jgi:hypothetical protein
MTIAAGENTKAKTRARMAMVLVGACGVYGCWAYGWP